MPILQCLKDGKLGWKYGKNNPTCFTGPGAREKARKQGIAIELSKKKRR